MTPALHVTLAVPTLSLGRSRPLHLSPPSSSRYSNILYAFLSTETQGYTAIGGDSQRRREDIARRVDEIGHVLTAAQRQSLV